jgi:hypothetical protein
MRTTLPDPAIDEIREVRHRISASCDHDPAKLVAFLMRFQEQFRDRLTYIPEQSDAQQAIQLDTNRAAGSQSATPDLTS